MKVTKAQIMRAETNLRIAGHTNVEADGHLTRAEKRTLKTVKQARGLKANAKLDKKTQKSIAKMAKQIGHGDQFVLGQKSAGILDAEKRLAASGGKHGKVDGILDKKSLAGIKAETNRQAATADGFDGIGYDNYYQSSFPQPTMAGPYTDPRADGYNDAYENAFPRTPGGTSPDPALADYQRRWEQFFPAPSTNTFTGPSDDNTVNAGDVMSPFFRVI